jgi:hypothetical protein
MQSIAHRGSPQQLESDSSLAALAPHIVETLHAEGVFTLSDWRQLGRKRKAIFGIVPSVCRMLDAAAREAT